MNKMLLIIFSILSIRCTPRCEEPIIIDRGKISERVLSYVPYQNGQTYRFQHSAGLVIIFDSKRQSRNQKIMCEECCTSIYNYEVNSTTLTPDYPIFDFGVEILNADTANIHFTARVGHYQFYIPTPLNEAKNNGFVDSVLIKDKVYYNVFKLKSNSYNYDKIEKISADSLYYNFQQGILQITMSNGEKYTIYE